MKTHPKLLIAMLLVFTFFSCSKEPLADKNDQTSSIQSDESLQKKSKSSGADKSFLISSAEDCQLEILLGTFAQSHASNADVILYGQKMVQEHTQELGDLKGFAQTYSLKLPKNIHGTQHQIIHKFSGLHGNDFDIEYMKFNLSHHQDDINTSNYEVSYGNDANIIDYVNATLLPMHYDHLGYATQIAQQLGIIP
jgi:predicted outer membrane protein